MEAKITFPIKKNGKYFRVIELGQKIAKRRLDEQAALRTHFFAQKNRVDNGEKLIVYLGGNNDDYFNNAFPAFLSFLTTAIETTDLSSYVIVLQQHPAAIIKRIDSHAVEAWVKNNGIKPFAPRILVSDLKSEDSLIAADGVLYYQTSMGPSIVLAGIPIMQVGHKRFNDVLVRSNLSASVTNAKAMTVEMQNMQTTPLTDEMKKTVLISLGINHDWLSILKNVLTKKEIR